jgi:hemerythrin-like domain-containing protein
MTRADSGMQDVYSTLCKITRYPEPFGLGRSVPEPLAKVLEEMLSELSQIQGEQVSDKTCGLGELSDRRFDDPIGMLKDSHRHIESFLDLLCTVVQRAHSRALTLEESNAVDAALHYFRVGGQCHKADEEKSLFPRLRADWTMSSVEEIDGLEGDARKAESLRARLEKLYEEWIEKSWLSPENEQHLLTTTKRLKHLYEEHIRVEELVVFPHAAEVLDRQTIAAIGQEFRDRRLALRLGLRRRGTN